MNVRDVITLVLIALAIGTIYPFVKDQLLKVLGKKQTILATIASVLVTLYSLKYLSQFADDAFN